jgi:AraC-like DNA-binding protein
MVDLNRLLDGLDIQVEPFAICEVRAGAGLVLENATSAHIHYVLEGSGMVRSTPGPDLKLMPHTVVVIPAGVRATILCHGSSELAFPQPRCRPIPGGWDWIEVGEGDAVMVVACANLAATRHDVLSLFEYLPSPLVENVAREAVFKDAFQLLLTELAFPKAGTPILAATLMKQCLIVLLRRYVEDGVCRAPWLAALEHPQLGQALAAMVEHPGRSFTLEQLADLAGMSRAAFANHFKKAFGRPPMDVLREVRLRRAAHLLARTDLPVKVVASQVGFGSRSHFSRAFRTYSGQDPAGFRAAAATPGASVRLSPGAQGDSSRP